MGISGGKFHVELGEALSVYQDAVVWITGGSFSANDYIPVYVYGTLHVNGGKFSRRSYLKYDIGVYPEGKVLLDESLIGIVTYGDINNAFEQE